MTPRRAALGLAAVALLLLAGWLAASGARWYRTADLFCLIEGARFVSVGQDPYDEAAWRPLIERTYPDPFRGSGPTSCVARYASPLWTAVVMLPFALVPLEVGTSLWMAVSFGAAVAGMRWIWLASRGAKRLAPVFAVLVVGSQPFWLLVVGGQVTGVLLGVLGLGVWLASWGRPFGAGAALALLAIKPQVFGVFVPAVAVREAAAGRRAPLFGAVGTGALLLGASLAARPDWVGQWIAEITERRLAYAELFATSWGLAKDLFGTSALAPILVALVTAGVWLLVRRRDLGPVAFAGLALSLSLFAMPHVWSYDMLVLALPVGTSLAIADRLPPVRRGLVVGLTVAASSALPWVLYAIGHARGQETLSAVIPVAVALVLATAIRLRPDPRERTP